MNDAEQTLSFVEADRKRNDVFSRSVAVALAVIVVALLSASVWRRFAHPLPLKSPAVGIWRSLPAGGLKAGDIVYTLNPTGRGTEYHRGTKYSHDRMGPVEWSQKDLHITVVEHAADGSAGENRFDLSADGKTLQETEEIAYPSLSYRIQHMDFAANDVDVAMPVQFRKL